jgi:hypothetical protein
MSFLTLVTVFCLMKDPTICEHHRERVYQKMSLTQCNMTAQFRAAHLATTLFTQEDGYKFHHAKCIQNNVADND